jgi:hypothetical protein
VIDLSETQTEAGLVIHVHHKPPQPVADAAGIVIDVTPNADVGRPVLEKPKRRQYRRPASSRYPDTSAAAACRTLKTKQAWRIKQRSKLRGESVCDTHRGWDRSF